MGSKHAKTKNKMTPEKEARLLRHKLKIINSLPDDFRDIRPGSEAWRVFQEILPERVEEMNAWVKGPILIFHTLYPLEKRVLSENDARTLVEVIGVNPERSATFILQDWTQLCGMTEEAIEAGASHIYMRNSLQRTVEALNHLASVFGLPFRFIQELKNEQGHIPGESY